MTRTISLTGFMGCGKSSIGRKLSALLSCTSVDLDNYIESREGCPVADIFKSGGEASFRAIELSCLSEILSTGKISSASAPDLPITPRDSLGRDGKNSDDRLLVISLGGGTLTTPECVKIVSEHTTCIYLRATTDTLIQHLENDYESRPMLHSAVPLRTRIEELMQKRSAIYESTAHHIVDIDGKSITDIANEIIPLL